MPDKDYYKFELSILLNLKKIYKIERIENGENVYHAHDPKFPSRSVAEFRGNNYIKMFFDDSELSLVISRETLVQLYMKDKSVVEAVSELESGIDRELISRFKKCGGESHAD